MLGGCVRRVCLEGVLGGMKHDGPKRVSRQAATVRKVW